jgi:Uma2 family endonuclease
MREPAVVLTYREYAALPADGRRYEIHDGELSVTRAPSPQHQRTVGNLCLVLHAHVAAGRLGEVLLSPLDVILSDVVIVQPDLVYLELARLGAISQRGVEGPPTLVVEVLSPSTVLIDRTTKRQLYARHRVPFYWLVDPDARAVEVLQLGPAGYDLILRAAGASPISPAPFPDFALVPDDLWL